MSLPTKAADRKATPIATGVLDYFPDAIAEVARVSKAGNDQHNPGQPLHWAKNKSTDHADCIARHLLERGTIDTDGQRHSAKVAWRALALLQVELDQANEGPEFSDGPEFEGWEDRAPIIQSLSVYDSNPVPEPKNIVVSFAGNEVSLVDVLEAVIQGSQPGTFRDTARELQLQMKEIVEANKAKEVKDYEQSFFTPILFEAPLPAWPDKEGIWQYVVDGDKQAPFTYLVDGEKDKDGFLILKNYKNEGLDVLRTARIFHPGSPIQPEFDEAHFADNPNITWHRVSSVPADPGAVEAAHAALDAAFDDGVNYDAEEPAIVDGTSTAKTIASWPEKPGVWGYVPIGDPDQEVTDERYEVTDRATHGGEYLVRKFGSGEFFRRPGSQPTLAVAEFGDEVRGWKLLEA